ncbi:Uncharacterized protein Rs2_02201 [Raphanus sativus]|nr:Uncharacterized protein Rs2_02201 [Raphanus sativus]
MAKISNNGPDEITVGLIRVGLSTANPTLSPPLSFIHLSFLYPFSHLAPFSPTTIEPHLLPTTCLAIWEPFLRELYDFSHYQMKFERWNGPPSTRLLFGILYGGALGVGILKDPLRSKNFHQPENLVDVEEGEEGEGEGAEEREADVCMSILSVEVLLQPPSSMRLL